MARDVSGRLSGYGSHKDKRLKREQNLLQRLLEEELEDFDSDYSGSAAANDSKSGVVFRSRTK